MSYTYDKILDASLTAGKSSGLSDVPLMEKYRRNGSALLDLLATGHAVSGSLIKHLATAANGTAHTPGTGSVLDLGGGWNPDDMTELYSNANLLIPNGLQAIDLEAPPDLTEEFGFVYAPMAAWVDGTDNFDPNRGLRLTPTMIKLLVRGEVEGGGVPAGHVALSVWKIPVMGQQNVVPAWVTWGESEIVPVPGQRLYLSHLFFRKPRDRDEYLYRLFLGQHASDGTHKMGLSQMRATKLLDRQAITADPGGAARQTFTCNFTGTPAIFIEAFADGAGDTGIDLRFAFTGAGQATKVLVADRVAGGTTASDYEVTVWALT